MTFTSFTWRLAVAYLAGENPPLGPRPIPGADPKDFFLGNARSRHFHSDDGPYAKGDAGGVGFLLDCRSDGNFLHLTGSQVLSGNFPRERLKDAVVFLGMGGAASVKDDITTPISVNEWGVDVHARTVDQLLRMAIKGEKQLRFLPNWTYVLWTFLWTVAGGVLGYRIRRPVWQVAGVAGGLALLMLIAWTAFRFAWWGQRWCRNQLDRRRGAGRCPRLIQPAR